MEQRVRFFRKDDMAYGIHLDKIETIQIPKIENIDINDAIEFNEIKRYFDDGVRAKSWSDKELTEYRQKSSALDALSKRYFNQMSDDSIIDEFNNIDLFYYSSFWTLFNNCKLYNKISKTVFEQLLNCKHANAYDFLKHDNIVKKYGKVIKNYILKDFSCVPILLDIYEQDYVEGEKHYLPIELSATDICNYFEEYIDSEDPNANYLSEIINTQFESRFQISDEIRLKAKRKYKKQLKIVFERGANLDYTLQVVLSQKQIENVKYEEINNLYNISYSTRYLEETLEYPDILNNFIYLFDFVDCHQMRSLHVCKSSLSGAIESAFAPKSRKNYFCNFAFKFIQELASLQMSAYYDFLETKGIRLEDVLKWFFTEYLQKEFSCPEIRVSFPSTGTSYSEKCSIINTSFDTVLKQYRAFLKNGDIDFELIAMSSVPVAFGDIKSQIKHKYIYGGGKDCHNLTTSMFSNQSILAFVERIYKKNGNCDSFYSLLCSEDIYISDYREDDEPIIKYLSDFDLITINNDGKIEIKNKIKVAILYDLFNNEVISRQSYSLSFQKDVEDYIDKGILIEESTLFSRPEINYLNFMLNRSEYNNGYDLRNRYMHGTQQVVIDEKEHKNNYNIFLRLFVLLAIKINDEFCLKEKIDNIYKS